MEEGPPPPSPPARAVPRILLIAAVLCSALAAWSASQPWHTLQWLDTEEIHLGITYVEGILQLVLGAVAALLFLAALFTGSPAARSRIAVTAACLALGLAFVPVELIAREARMGKKTVVIVGVGYSGWSRGLYLALVAGFAAAATGSAAATKMMVPRTVTVTLRSRRRPVT
jgi:hypothetical protein